MLFNIFIILIDIFFIMLYNFSWIINKTRLVFQIKNSKWHWMSYEEYDNI